MFYRLDVGSVALCFYHDVDVCAVVLTRVSCSVSVECSGSMGLGHRGGQLCHLQKPHHGPVWVSLHDWFVSLPPQSLLSWKKETSNVHTITPVMFGIHRHTWTGYQKLSPESHRQAFTLLNKRIWCGVFFCCCGFCFLFFFKERKFCHPESGAEIPIASCSREAKALFRPYINICLEWSNHRWTAVYMGHYMSPGITYRI